MSLDDVLFFLIEQLEQTLAKLDKEHANLVLRNDALHLVQAIKELMQLKGEY